MLFGRSLVLTTIREGRRCFYLVFSGGEWQFVVFISHISSIGK